MAVLMITITFKTHTHVHWWSNGVAELTEWPLVELSDFLTQHLNTAATQVVGFLVHQRDADDMQDVLGHNMREGFPMHGNIKKYIKESTTHAMTASARKALAEM